VISGVSSRIFCLAWLGVYSLVVSLRCLRVLFIVACCFFGLAWLHSLGVLPSSLNSLVIFISVALAGHIRLMVPAMVVSAACCFFRLILCSRFMFFSVFAVIFIFPSFSLVLVLRWLVGRGP